MAAVLAAHEMTHRSESLTALTPVMTPWNRRDWPTAMTGIGTRADRPNRPAETSPGSGWMDADSVIPKGAAAVAEMVPATSTSSPSSVHEASETVATAGDPLRATEGEELW